MTFKHSNVVFAPINSKLFHLYKLTLNIYFCPFVFKRHVDYDTFYHYFQGCELEAGESRGLTALIYAAACGKKDMLEIMIPRCKNVDVTDKKVRMDSSHGVNVL